MKRILSLLLWTSLTLICLASGILLTRHSALSRYCVGDSSLSQEELAEIVLEPTLSVEAARKYVAISDSRSEIVGVKRSTQFVDINDAERTWNLNRFVMERSSGQTAGRFATFLRRYQQPARGLFYLPDDWWIPPCSPPIQCFESARQDSARVCQFVGTNSQLTYYIHASLPFDDPVVENEFRRLVAETQEALR